MESLESTPASLNCSYNGSLDGPSSERIDAHLLTDPLSVDDVCYEDVLEKAYQIWRTARGLLVEIGNGDFQSVRLLCRKSGLSRNAYLARPAHDRRSEKELWAAFAKAYHRRELVDLPLNVAYREGSRLVSTWMDRSDRLAAHDRVQSRRVWLGYLDCSIELMRAHCMCGQAKNQARLIEAYTKRGDLLQSFESMDCLQAAIDSYDQALCFSKSVTNDEKPELMGCCLSIADKISAFSEGLPDAPDRKIVHRLERDETDLSGLVRSKTEERIPGDEWQSLVERIAINRSNESKQESIPPNRRLSVWKAAGLALLITFLAGILWKKTLGKSVEAEEPLPPAFSDEPIATYD